MVSLPFLPFFVCIIMGANPFLKKKGHTCKRTVIVLRYSCIAYGSFRNGYKQGNILMNKRLKENEPFIVQ